MLVVISVGSNPVHGFGVRDFWSVWLNSCFDFGRKMNLGLKRFEVQFFPDLGLSSANFWQNMFKVWVFWTGSKFDFGGQTWVQVSLEFELSSWIGFEVHYISSAAIYINCVVIKKVGGKYVIKNWKNTITNRLSASASFEIIAKVAIKVPDHVRL